LLALGALIALAGCGGTGTATSSRHASPGHQLRIGQSAVLSGEAAGEALKVTLLAFSANLSGGPDDHPEFDMQYVQADLRLTNVGSVAYRGAPQESVTIYTNEGQKSRRALLSEGPCANGFAREVEIAPGASAQGCVPLQIAVVAAATKLRFAMGRRDGRARGVAEWSLAKRR
jgi:hypothetical protein